MSIIKIKILLVIFVTLLCSKPLEVIATNKAPQVPPKITRPSKPASKPNVKPRTPANRSHRQSSQSSRPTSPRENSEPPRVNSEPPRVNQEPLSNRTFTVNGVNFTMVGVQGGTFQMGSTTGDSDEKPVHSVTLSSYYIGQTEVTQALWKAVMGSNPSSFKGDNLPVEKVSWNDCQTFINKLNSLTGQHFRLPTEAEWEFAARGGTKSNGYTYSGSNNIDNVAWYYVNTYDKGSSSHDYGTHIVKTKSPNELGIYDMSGNVWEWCQDWYGDYSSSSQTNPTGPSSGSNRVLRGGGWNIYATYCRTANRLSSTPTFTGSDLGFRLAL